MDVNISILSNQNVPQLSMQYSFKFALKQRTMADGSAIPDPCIKCLR